LESYVELCEHEGRLHTDYECLLCEMPIEGEISLVRSFLPTHPKCSYSKAFHINKIKDYFENKSLVSLNDEEVNYLWEVLLQGL
jgi:hypothetical protein